MDTQYTVGIIGTGRPHNTEGFTGWGMAHSHARGYNRSGHCKIVALCDLNTDWADVFNTEHAQGEAKVFSDYHEMLAEMKPDFVSICTWPRLHAPMVIAAANAGVRAIHCEKPMAPTWHECREMAHVCAEKGVQLSFNHQRRFGGTFQRAHRLVTEGAIGELRRMEAACPNLHDWGTHWINMMGFFNAESAPAWVIGQADMREPKPIFALMHETSGISHFGYENGVTATLFASPDAEKNLGCAIRLHGSEGYMEIRNSQPNLVIRGVGDATVRTLEVDGLHALDAVELAIADAVDALRAGRKPLLDVSNALHASEIIFATYESARRGARVELPLESDADIIAQLIDRAAATT